MPLWQVCCIPVFGTPILYQSHLNIITILYWIQRRLLNVSNVYAYNYDTIISYYLQAFRIRPYSQCNAYVIKIELEIGGFLPESPTDEFQNFSKKLGGYLAEKFQWLHFRSFLSLYEQGVSMYCTWWTYNIVHFLSKCNLLLRFFTSTLFDLAIRFAPLFLLAFS